MLNKLNDAKDKGISNCPLCALGNNANKNENLFV